MNTPLPPLSDPRRYVGLFVYDFGDHTAVGYTAGEVRVLREAEAYRGGSAYQIYRVDERGRVELRGVIDERLTAQEATCFLRDDAGAARADHNQLLRLAEERPLPCPCEAMLGRVYDWTPPHVLALLYPAHAAHLVAGWLQQVNFAGGDDVIAGTDVCGELLAASALWIDRRTLPGAMSLVDRPAEEVLQNVKIPVQR